MVPRQEHRTLYVPIGMNQIKALFSCCLFALMSTSAFATHNRAGEIIVCSLGGFTYQATIITYTKLSSIAADRDSLELNWGDGTLVTLSRSSIVDDTSRDLRTNRYVGNHQYTGPGNFTLTMEDPNRNAGVNNIPQSVTQPFALRTTLTISPNTGQNCSVQFLNEPIQDACIFQPWIHNPAAFDPDGDSLSYEPAVCLGLGALPIPDYVFPSPGFTVPPDIYSIDPTNGTIVWNAPNVAGEYNIAFIVREWKLVGGQWYEVGSVLRDMQITVISCTNVPPVVSLVADTCIEVGSILSFNVQASDPNTDQLVTLEALGQPFEVPISPATFISPSPTNPINGTFNWNIDCSHVRTLPYQIVFSATDNAQGNNNAQLSNYSVMNVKVVAPAPLNPLATPSGDEIALTWDASVCANATGYDIYRRNGSYGFVHGYCETGVPAYTGYTQIGSTSGLNSTSYTDNGALAIGSEYCYMIVARFANGGNAESYASVEFCTILDRQVPVITKVSVGVTDVTAGVDTVHWSSAYDLDTIARPGPYQFKLYRGDGFMSANQLIYTSGLSNFIAHPDTMFVDNGIDTETMAHVYRVELLGAGGNDTIGSSSPASSVFIDADPNDEQVTISWTYQTPWLNTSFDVYRFNGVTWDFVGTSTEENYVDTGLVNGVEYCYYVVSTGAYGDTTIVSPLYNWSQEVCAIPVDLTPPCAPTVTLDNDCEEPLNTLQWNNPNSSCADDTYGYFVYFADSLGGTFNLIATITNAVDTVFTHVDGASVAGCYLVTAVDTVGNESAFGTPVCGDNCPEYTLPNIFSPNGDRSNDQFGPFPYRGVKEIDLEVFNRWGQIVFTATDPDINWKGTYMDTDQPLPDGVYYYVCQVVFRRLAGDEAMVLKGYVHITGSGVPASQN